MAGLFYTGYFFFGACLMAILNKGVAHMVGKLSPNFLSVCKPNYTSGALVFTRHVCSGMLNVVGNGRVFEVLFAVVVVIEIVYSVKFTFYTSLKTCMQVNNFS